MDDKNPFFEFDNFKLSAFSKYAAINPEEFKYVTIGPNSIYKSTLPVLECGSLNIDTQKFQNPNVNGERQCHEVPNACKRNIGNEKFTSTKQTINKEDEGLPIREIIKDLEQERHSYVQNAMQKHLDRFKRHSEFLEHEKKEQLLNQQRKLIQDMHQEEQKIINMLVEVDANKVCEHEKLVKYYQKLAEKRRKNAAELEAKEKLRQELNMNINEITKINGYFTNTYREILNYIKTAQANNELRISLPEEIKLLKHLFATMEEVYSKCKTTKLSRVEVEIANECLTRIQLIKEQILTKINESRSKNIESAKSKVDIKASVMKNEVQNVESNQQTKAEEDDNVTFPTSLNKYISKENLRLYSEIIQFSEKHVASFKALSDNPNLKQFRFDCKKAINIPVNAISAVSSHHLRDKYDRLYNLLTGKEVKIADNVYLCAMRHPQGIAFCIDLLARKMVLQGDLMISSNPESAFCYATIIVALWNALPDFGKLFLAYLYKTCPYLVPFNIPKSTEQSDEDFYKSQGYQYTDGQIEKQDKYLKRMTGIMRLYAAVIISKPRAGQMNPHGIENGWRWLASILKLEPRLDITATLIHTFLEVAGYHMQMVYKRAFRKLVHIITIKFLPIMKQNDSGGPVTRLEVLLQEYQQKAQFDKPSGILPDNFW